MYPPSIPHCQLFSTPPCHSQVYYPPIPHTYYSPHPNLDTPRRNHTVVESPCDSDAESVTDWIDFEEHFENYDLGPPYKIKKNVIDDCYKKATSKSNLAVQLVRKVYTKHERATSNSSGDHRYKKKKLSPARMEAVKSATFSIYPVRPGVTEEEAWKQFKIAIDTSCRQIYRSRKRL